MKDTNIKISVGAKVYWHDPLGEASGVYEILKITDDFSVDDFGYDDLILIIGNGYSQIEVFISELEFL